MRAVACLADSFNHQFLGMFQSFLTKGQKRQCRNRYSSKIWQDVVSVAPITPIKTHCQAKSFNYIILIILETGVVPFLDSGRVTPGLSTDKIDTGNCFIKWRRTTLEKIYGTLVNCAQNKHDNTQHLNGEEHKTQWFICV